VGQEHHKDLEGLGQEHHKDLEGLGQEHHGGFTDDKGGEGDRSAIVSASKHHWFRRSHVVAPPIAPQPDNKVVSLSYFVLCFNCKFNFNVLTFLCICRSWIDSGFDRTSRKRLVNQVLGNPCCLHYPGMMTLPSGKQEITTT
jgi:hypothetical protein